MLNFFAMYLLYHEFHWYVSQRHIYMSKKQPQSYTVHIGGVPKHLRSAKALGDFLRILFNDDVFEINFAR